MKTVYGRNVPSFEIESFMAFFDSNHDGRISWEEFERGLGDAMSRENAAGVVARANGMALPGSFDDIENIDDDYDDLDNAVQPRVSGEIEVELDNGEVVTVEAQKFLDSLRREADSLQEALRKESTLLNGALGEAGIMSDQKRDESGIAGYIASRQGDVKALTEGISPEIIATMRMLVDFVLEGGNVRKKNIPKEQIEMEIPGSALQQLALWQLILGYKLREAEATGDYLKVLK